MKQKALSLLHKWEALEWLWWVTFADDHEHGVSWARYVRDCVESEYMWIGDWLSNEARMLDAELQKRARRPQCLD